MWKFVFNRDIWIKKGLILYFLILKSFIAPVTTSRYNIMTRAWGLCLEDITTTTLLISDSGLASSITTNCWSTSKETDELLAPLAEAATPTAIFLCFYNQASFLSLFLAASFLACLRGERVDSLEGSTRAYFNFFLPMRLYSKSSSPSEISSSTCCSSYSWASGSFITIPLSFRAGLATLVAGCLTGVAAFMGSETMSDSWSSEERSSASFNNLLLLVLLSSEIGERSL